MRPPPDPERVALARRLIQAGHTRPSVAEAMRVSTSTIDRWLRLPVPAEPPAAAPPAAAPPDPEPPADDDDVLSLVREEIRELRRARREATRLHDPSMRIYAAAIGRIAPLLARLEARQDDDAGVVRIPRAEIERAKAALAERVRKIREAGPLLCARCGADVRREAATG
jgi:hypothetical protein